MKKILFLDSYYQGIIESLSLTSDLNTLSEFRDEISANRFGTGTALSTEFERLGWQTEVIVPNFLQMQTAWRQEHGLGKPIRHGWNYGPHIARMPFGGQLASRLPHIHQTLVKQIEHMQPDVVYIQDLNLLNASLIKTIKVSAGLIVGEIASPLPPRKLLVGYDLIVSALDPIVDEITKLGIESRWVPLGFDLNNWSDFDASKHSRNVDVVFIGSISRLQKSTLPLIAAVANTVENFSVYGPTSTGRAMADASLSHIYKGEAWGSRMFEILGSSKISLNRHGEIAQGFATNMRMFESTGMGALLLTDATKKLDRLFIENQELLTYSSPIEAAGVIPEVLKDLDRLESVANSGQRRTHAEHTYANRAERLQEIFAEIKL